MKEKPILFNTVMVTAIRAGIKTETRRVVKFPEQAYTPDTKWIASVNPDGAGDWVAWGPTAVSDEFSINAYPDGGGFKCPYGKPGDRLWVRETWRVHKHFNGFKPSAILHNSAYVDYKTYPGDYDLYGKWRPSIFMPRWMSRITLEVLSVGVERVQDISDEDAVKEGANASLWDIITGSRVRFKLLWNSINASRGYSWKSNPWVWVVKFKLLEGKNGIR